MIKLTNLNKYYNKNKHNEIHVINDVSMSLPENGLITFLGQSGSGKTTLLNVIGGLDKASGEIVYDDKKIKRYNIYKVDKIRREKISYIFQNYNLLPSETVYDNLKIALHAINITNKKEIDKRISYALKKVSMYKYRKKLASSISGGQMQRVAIARCLIKNSKVIIADEPTGNLDSANSLDIMNILKKISKTSLVLLVTHDKALAEYFSDEIVEIVDGKIVNIRKSDKNSTYVNMGDNNIYLKDLIKKEENSENSNITYFFENDEKNIDLTLVEHNGIFYLKSSKKIKLLSDTNFNLLDKKESDEKVIVDEDFDFDTNIFSNNVLNSNLSILFKQIKDSFFNFFNKKKRTKFFHFAMFLIGIIVAFINISYANYNYVDSSQISYANDVYIIKENEKAEALEALTVAKTNGYIKEVYRNYAYYCSFEYFKNSYVKRYMTLPNIFIFDIKDLNSESIIKGKIAETDKEIVISEKYANDIAYSIDKSASFDTLINLSINVSGTNYTIVGITSKDAYCAYGLDMTSSSISKNSLFTINNEVALKRYLENNNLTLKKLYDYQYENMKDENKESKEILLPVIIILVAISLIYIYFSMRSKMLNDIYTIGVYRALSYSRSKIMLKYSIDILFMTLFTTVLGYLSVTIIHSYITGKINVLSMELIKNVVVTTQGSTYLILLILIIASNIIGLLPIMSLLRKTPSQILSKYDI